MVLEQPRWVLGLSQGLVWAVVLRGRVCVLPTAAVTALLQGLLLELPREASVQNLIYSKGNTLPLNSQCLQGPSEATLSATGWVRWDYLKLRSSSECRSQTLSLQVQTAGLRWELVGLHRDRQEPQLQNVENENEGSVFPQQKYKGI